MCSSVLGTEVTQPDRSLITSVLGQFGPQKRTEVTKDRSGCTPSKPYSAPMFRGKISGEGEQMSGHGRRRWLSIIEHHECVRPVDSSVYVSQPPSASLTFLRSAALSSCQFRRFTASRRRAASSTLYPLTVRARARFHVPARFTWTRLPGVGPPLHTKRHCVRYLA